MRNNHPVTSGERAAAAGICLVTALAMLAICSKSSLLYPMNDWVDAQCYFTVARAMRAGQVLYRDIFEQKGPVLYFLHMGAVRISETSFLGVYLLEAVAGFFILYVSYRLMRLYASPRCILCIPVLALFIYTAACFCHGDSVEELVLPLYAWMLYSLLAYFKGELKRPMLTAALMGFACGCVFLMKFTLVGGYVGAGLVLFLTFCIRKRVGEALAFAGVFLAGFAASFVPWFIYFTLHGAVGDFLTAYFYDNLFLYGKHAKGMELLHTVVKALRDAFGRDPAALIGSGLGCILLWFLPRRLAPLPAKAAVTCAAVFTILFVYAGGRSYPYYSLIFLSYLPLSATVLSAAMDRLAGEKIRLRLLALSALVLSCFCTASSYFLSGNVYLMHTEKEEMPQFEFARVIGQVENATLLNYGFLDGGFYYASGVLPTCKYFCKLNLNLPEMTNVQTEAIKAEEFDFVVTRGEAGESAILRHYTCVESATFYFEGHDWTYYLYRRNSLS